MLAATMPGCASLEGLTGGAGDAGTTSVDGGAGWCASRPTPPTFCADFDETTDLSTVVATWSQGAAGDGSMAVQSQGDAPSPPNVLSASADGTQALAYTGSIVLANTVSKGAPLSTVHAEAQLRLDNGAITGALDSAALLTVSFADAQVYLAFSKGGLLLAVQEPGDAGTYSYTAVPGTLTPALWAGSFAIDVDLKEGKVKVSHDAIDVANASLAPPSSSPQSVTIRVGVVDFGQTGTIGFSFDNVLMSLE
jgi:hypothetical protein